MLYHEFRAMNTDILLAAEGSTEEAAFAFPQIQAFVEANERRFTRFSESSELSALNRSAGTWFEASEELFEVIQLALRFHELTRFGEQTKALFDPSILSALEYAGYDRSFEQVQIGMPLLVNTRLGERTLPPDGAPTFADVRLDPAGRQLFLPPGLRIDLGGIAKGWIAEQAARLLSTTALACAVDAGGDMYFHGLPSGETGWQVSIADPWEEEKDLAAFKVGPGAVATSSVMKRRWEKRDASLHHLIDPRTQRPVNSDWVSVTVVAQHTVEAEIYAKVLLIGGQQIAEEVVESVPGIAFITVDKNKNLWGSKHSRELFDV